MWRQNMAYQDLALCCFILLASFIFNFLLPHHITSSQRARVLSALHRDLLESQGHIETSTVNGEVWMTVPKGDSIYAVTSAGTIRSMAIRAQNHSSTPVLPHKLIQLNESTVLLAAETGIYLLDLAGEISQVLVKGNFSDIGLQQNVWHATDHTTGSSYKLYSPVSEVNIEPYWKEVEIRQAELQLSCLDYDGDVMLSTKASCHNPASNIPYNTNRNYRVISQAYADVLPKLQTAINFDQGEIVHHLSGQAYRMAMVQQSASLEIWLPVLNKDFIEVISMSGKAPRKIYFPDWCNLMPRALVQVDDFRVILAAQKGLFVLNLSGGIQDKLCNGYFTDVVTDSQNVYAVNMKSKRVHVLTKSASSYTVGRSFSIEIEEGEVIVTLSVNRKYSCCLYVAGYADSTIWQYSTEGHLIGTFPKLTSGSVSPPDLLLPFVVGRDSDGSLLVSDRDHNRLLEYADDPALTSGWQEYRLTGLIKPRDVLFTDKGVYVLWGPCHIQQVKLSFYPGVTSVPVET